METNRCKHGMLEGQCGLCKGLHQTNGGDSYGESISPTNKGYIDLKSEDVRKTLLYLADNGKIEGSVPPDLDDQFRSWYTEKTGDVLGAKPKGYVIDTAANRWKRFKLVITVKKPDFDLNFGTYKVCYIGNDVAVYSKELTEILFSLGFKLGRNHDKEAIKSEVI